MAVIAQGILSGATKQIRTFHPAHEVYLPEATTIRVS